MTRQRNTWRVWREDEGEDDASVLSGTRLSAFGNHVPMDAEEIATEWAARSDADSADYVIVNGDNPIVIVEDPEGHRSKWRVEGHSVPEYLATEVQA